MRVVHCLHEGRALCGRYGIPAEWPDGHVWAGMSGRIWQGDVQPAESTRLCEDCGRRVDIIRRDAVWSVVDFDRQCRCGIAEAMKLVFVWDDAQMTDHAFNVYACNSCGTLVKVDVWDDAGELWIGLNGVIDRED